MISESVQKWMEKNDERREKALALDSTAAAVEALGIGDVSIVERVAEPIVVFIRRDLEADEHMSRVAADTLPKLAKLGHRLQPDRDGKTYSDYPEIGRREWRLSGNVLFACFTYYGDKSVCRFVKSGTKTEDTYELVCD